MHAEEIIDALDLEPHPEGGHFAETWRVADPSGGRASATAIFFLLKAGERSHWHRVDADELWLFHAGDPLRLTIANDGGSPRSHLVGPDFAAGQHPQVIVPAHAWQSAESDGGWTLVSCVVSPGFEFEGFELAPPGWSPDAR